MAIACLRIPHLTLRIALLDQPELDGLPLLLSSPENGRAIVIDVSDEAAEKGLRPGLTLREATALCPDAVIIMPNPALESRIRFEIMTRLESLSPLVEADEHDTGSWYIDLVGLERHFPSVTDAAQKIASSVHAILRPRVGVASTKFTARVASGVAVPGGVRIIPVDQEHQFLSGVPVSWLPFSPDMVHQLRRLGLPTLGDLARLPPAKLAARFGPDGRLAWQLARGADQRMVLPRPAEQVVIEQIAMPTPVVSREMLMIGIRQLVHRAFARPDMRGKQVRQVTLRAMLENRRSWERPLILKHPYGQAGLIEALNLRLHSVDIPGPIEDIVIQLTGIVNESSRQGLLPVLQPRHQQLVTDAVDQLRHRYGLSPLYRVMEVEPWSRIPERRHALITFEP